MREIKFRAWDKTSNIMRNDISSIDYHQSGSIAQINVISGSDILFPDLEAELMQYTGLKDKNGVEIYEGDIITSVTDGYGDNETMTVSGSVYWDDEDASFMIWGWGRTLGQVVQKEVTGNKYENPYPRPKANPTHLVRCTGNNTKGCKACDE